MRIALYTADRWEHVCPVVRVLGPAEQLGFQIVHGSRWEAYRLYASPEGVLRADVVVIQRDFPRFRELYEQVMRIAHKEGKPVIYDIDDWLLELPATHPDSNRYGMARIPILQAILEADGVTCPSPMLAEYLRRFNKNVAVLPNYLNESLWKEAIHKPDLIEERDTYPVVIGYMGGHSHIPDLKMVEPVLVEILRQYGDRVKMRFWGCPPPVGLQGWKNVEWTEIGLVSYAEFARYFSKQTCDIFIAPLVDSPFNRAKSALKFLEYSILGVPGVYSHIAPYESVIIHGENGFLARDLRAWKECILQLIEDPSLRQQMGRKARETVMENWLLADHAQEWREVYRRLATSWNAGEELPREAVADSMRKLQVWDDEKARAIADSREVISKLWSDIRAVEVRLAEKERLIEEILASPGWKLVTMLGTVRSWIAPPGSRREQLLFWGISLLQRWIGRIRRPEPMERQGSAGDSLVIPEVIKQVSEPPLISIVVEEGTDAVNVDSVQAWVKTQTYPAAEVIVWERSAARAYVAGSPDNEWSAPTVQSLVDGLRGAYICVASLNLLQQTETCLEVNLIALESEGLVFTVNWQGDPTEAGRWLRLGWIPKALGNPCVYVVRKEALCEDFSVNLLRIGAYGRAVKVGKIVTYPAGGDGRESSPGPAIRVDGDARLYVDGNDVLITPLKGESDREPFRSVARPIGMVVPPLPLEEDSRPSVLVVMPFLAVGGAERVALEIMYQLRGEICFIIATVERHVPFLGSMVGLFRQVTPYVYTVFDWLSTQLRFSFLEYLIDRFSPHTLYIANGSDWIYDALGLIKRRYPDLRIVNQVYDHRMGWISRYDAQLAALVDAHIGCNEKICYAYRQRGVSSERIHLIEHGIDTDQFDPGCYSEDRRNSVREQMGLPLEGKVITFMGRLHPQKRPMDFVELARRFAHQPDRTFLMVGDGPMAGIIDGEVQRIGLRNLVRRSFSQATDVLAISDVVVLPSEYEGMPMVVLEAQAMGKPVVVTDVGNTRKILEVTGGGVLVQAIGDIGALAEGVNEMLKSPPNPERVRQAVITHFDVRKTVALYKRVLLGRRTDAQSVRGYPLI